MERLKGIENKGGAAFRQAARGLIELYEGNDVSVARLIGIPVETLREWVTDEEETGTRETDAPTASQVSVSVPPPMDDNTRCRS